MPAAEPKKKETSTVVEQVRKKLGHLPMLRQPTAWLDTGHPRLNAVLGREDRGLAWGRMVEVFGMESQGKTLIAFLLAIMAQKQGAEIIWVDLETSWDQDFGQSLGLDCSRVHLIQPYVGVFDKEKRLSTIQENCREAEAVMATLHEANPATKTLVIIDSVTAMLTEIESEAGLDSNMRVEQSLPKFLGRLARRWVGHAQAYQASIVFVNQMRTDPAKMFGDPNYTPGGNALRFYCHVRLRMRRLSGEKGRVRGKWGKIGGVVGVITNVKNKAGGREPATCGYKLMFDGKAEFMSEDEIKKLSQE